MDEVKKTFKVPVENIPSLNERMEEINKKADKLGVARVQLNVINKFESMVWNPTENKAISHSFVEYEMIGETPKFAGWGLVAVIEHMSETDKNIVKEIPGKACPVEFRTAEMVVCDHCHTKRQRTAVFVIQHDNGEYKVIGRNCLSDFLGGQNPENIIRQAEILFSFISGMSEAEGDWEGYGSSGPRACSILQYLAVTSAIIRNCGWVPRSKADYGVCATADFAWSSVFSRKQEPEAEITDYDVDVANKVLAWARAIEDKDNNYLYNVNVCCQNEYVTSKTNGFVASAITAWKKAMGDEAERKNAVKQPSNWLGSIGQRLMLNLTVIGAKSYVSSMGFDKTTVRFIDEVGNIVVWFASGTPEWVEIGNKVNVKATINKHDCYAEQKQTIVSRVAKV